MIGGATLPSGAKHFGYRPDPAHKRTQKDSRFLLGTAPLTPPSASLEEFEYRPILDQNGCGSCGGHGTAQAIYTSLKAAGAALSWCPSPGDIYRVTRSLERAAASVGESLPPLDDSGVMPSDVMLAISQFGIRAMRSPSPQGFNSDVDPSNVNDEPKLDELEADAQKIVTGEYRIAEAAPDTEQQLRGAIAAGHAVGIGFFCDSAFQNWKAGDAPLDAVNLNDPSGGGHWVCATSYTTDATGRTIFRICNSWGADWADAGHINVTSAWLHAAASDLYIFKVTA